MDEQLISFLNEKAIHLEKKRKRGVKLNYFYRIIVPIKAILQVIIFILVVINFIAPILLPITFILIGVFLALSLMSDPKEVFEHNLKYHVIPEIFKHVNDTFQYSSSGSNSTNLKESGLLSSAFFDNSMTLEGKDYISGKIGNTDIEFFGVKFLKSSVNYLKTAGGCLLTFILLPIDILKSIFTGSDQNEDLSAGVIEDVKLYFSGFFIYADFKYKHKGKTLIIPKKKDKVFSFLAPKESAKIRLLNSYINQHYDVFTSDSSSAKRILSSNFIDKIEALSKREMTYPIISFTNGKMFFLIPWSKSFFKVNLFTKITDGNYFLPYIKEINFFQKIIKDLNTDI